MFFAGSAALRAAHGNTKEERHGVARSQQRSSFHRTVEDDPDGEIVGEILEAMLGMGGGEAHVAGPDRRQLAVDPIEPRAGGDDICGPSVGRGVNRTSSSPSMKASAERPGIQGRLRAVASEMGAGVWSMAASTFASTVR